MGDRIIIQTITEIVKYKFKEFEFKTLKEAQAFEKRYEEGEKISKLLKKLPKDDGCCFSNGEGYVQHDLVKLNNFYDALGVANIKKYGKKKEDREKLKEAVEKRAWSWIGRFYAEGDAIFHKMVWRALCIDDKGREFGQPYYANHPNEAKLFEIK